MTPKKSSYSLFLSPKGVKWETRSLPQLRVTDTGDLGTADLSARRPSPAARGKRGHPRTWKCGSLSGSGCGARVRLFHLLTLRQFDSLWARGREYFTASVLLIWDVKKKKKTGCLSSRLKYESESAGVKPNKSKTLAELTKETNLCNLKQIKYGLQYRKLLVTPQTQCTGTEQIAGTAVENWLPQHKAATTS